MTKEELFERIKSESASEEEYLINLLKFRGFLIDAGEQGYSLSDNGAREDPGYLDKLLKKYDLGQVEGNKLIITNADNAKLFLQEFKEGTRILVEACGRDFGWSYFKSRPCGHKAAVSWLEPYIARYVKAISACGVLTAGSCDGNHEGSKRMYLQLENQGSAPWLKVISEKCLVGRFRIRWIHEYQAMHLKPEIQFDTYYEVNKAAEFLYENRLAIRKIKRLALSDMSNSYFKHHTDEEITEEFTKRAEKLFDESGLCLRERHEHRYRGNRQAYSPR